MTDDHDRYEQWAAAYTLGALSTDDRKAFEVHVARCEICATDVADFAVLPGLLAKVSLADLEPVDGESSLDSIRLAARAELAGMNRSRRWWRSAAVAGAAISLLLAMLAVAGDAEPEQPGGEVAAVISSEADTTMIVTTAKAWGTQINVELTGLPRRDRYQLWAIGDDGAWSSAASWAPTSSRVARLIGATDMATALVDRIVVTSQDRADILVEVSV